MINKQGKMKLNGWLILILLGGGLFFLISKGYLFSSVPFSVTGGVPSYTQDLLDSNPYTVTFNVSQTGEYNISFLGWEDHAGSDNAQLTVRLDGMMYWSNTLLTAIPRTLNIVITNSSTLKKSLTAGQHNLSFTFTNDYYSPAVYSGTSNLLSNPSFTYDSGNNPTGWTTFNPTLWSLYTMFSHDSIGGSFGVLTTSAPVNTEVSESGLISVTPSTTLTLTGWAYATNNAQVNVMLYLYQDSTVTRGTGKTINYVNLPNQWQSFTIGTTTASNENKVKVVIKTSMTSGYTGTLYIDDLNLTNPVLISPAQDRNIHLANLTVNLISSSNPPPVQECTIDSDCQSALCSNGIYYSHSCLLNKCSNNSVSCNYGCTNSGCNAPPVCDNDGVCDSGETIANCPNDCHVATCLDGIQNQNEVGIDCGGPCVVCTGLPTEPTCPINMTMSADKTKCYFTLPSVGTCPANTSLDVATNSCYYYLTSIGRCPTNTIKDIDGTCYYLLNSTAKCAANTTISTDGTKCYFTLPSVGRCPGLSDANGCYYLLTAIARCPSNTITDVDGTCYYYITNLQAVCPSNMTMSTDKTQCYYPLPATGQCPFGSTQSGTLCYVASEVNCPYGYTLINTTNPWKCVTYPTTMAECQDGYTLKNESGTLKCVTTPSTGTSTDRIFTFIQENPMIALGVGVGIFIFIFLLSRM